jgi:hypothetical protein
MNKNQNQKELAAKVEQLEKLLSGLLAVLPPHVAAAIKAKAAGQDVEAAVAATVPKSLQLEQQILDGIPQDVKQALGAVAVISDPKPVWFQIVRGNGTRISVKRLENGFRIRVRDGEGGTILKEEIVHLNGLNNALKALAS